MWQHINYFSNKKKAETLVSKLSSDYLIIKADVSDEDEESGYIYVLKSKSEDYQISSINNLFKIGFSRTDVEERIKNAEKESTYLMAPVIIIGVWKCYNMNPQKFEHLLHTFFGNSCLEVDIIETPIPFNTRGILSAVTYLLHPGLL